MEDLREVLNQKFNKACEQGEVYSLRQILKEYPGYINMENNDGYGFKKACEKGFVNIIDYLIKTREVANNINLDFQENIGFFIACDYGKIEVLDYYFSHQEYKKMTGLINKVFITSCEKNNIKLYQLLKNTGLLNKVNPKWNKWYGFKLACKNEMTEIINDIIFELNMPLDEEIKEWLKNEKYERVINIFKKRDIYNQLKK